MSQVPEKHKAQCSEKSLFFVQYACLTPEKDQGTRRTYGLAIACLSVFVYLFIIVYIDYIKAVEATKYIDYDVETITAADYSVEFDLVPEQYAKFMSQYYMPENPMTEIAQFKLYIQKELTDRISNMDDLGVDGDEHLYQGGKKEIKIAQATFAFYNE